MNWENGDPIDPAGDSASFHRRSIRLRDYDYRLAGAYFVTICTHERRAWMGVQDGECITLTAAGKIVAMGWQRIPYGFEGVQLDEWVLMPDHLHGILILPGDAGSAYRGSTRSDWHGTSSGSLPAIVQNFKSISSRRIRRRVPLGPERLWQRNYYDRIIRNEKELQAIRQYIADNPKNSVEGRG